MGVTEACPRRSLEVEPKREELHVAEVKGMTSIMSLEPGCESCFESSLAFIQEYINPAFHDDEHQSDFCSTMDNTPAAVSVSPFAATEAHDKYYQDFGKWLGELSFDPAAWDRYLPNCSRDEIQERFVRQQLELYYKDEPHLINDTQCYDKFAKAMAHIIEHRYKDKGFGIFLECDEEMFESDEENCSPPSPVIPLHEIDALHEMCDRLCNNDDDCIIVKDIELIKID